MKSIKLPQLTCGSLHVIYDWLVVPLVAMVINQSGEVTQKFFNTGHDDADPRVSHELFQMLL